MGTSNQRIEHFLGILDSVDRILKKRKEKETHFFDAAVSSQVYSFPGTARKSFSKGIIKAN